MRLTLTRMRVGLAALLATCQASAQDIAVDLELVLAVDVSHSVDAAEGSLQRGGYTRALVDPTVIDAILSAPYGRIAVTYIEWADPPAWRTVVDWRIIDSAEAAHAFTGLLASAPVAGGQNTSITTAINRAVRLFEGSGASGARRVIDISGDGPNNIGGIVSRARDGAVAAGITINGLAINNFDGGRYSLPDLDVYYRECVVGGPGAFVVAADGFASFARAIRRKLIMEIAGAAPDVNMAQADGNWLALAGEKYAPDCDIGERMRFDGRITTRGGSP